MIKNNNPHCKPRWKPPAEAVEREMFLDAVNQLTAIGIDEIDANEYARRELARSRERARKKADKVDPAQVSARIAAMCERERTD